MPREPRQSPVGVSGPFRASGRHGRRRRLVVRRFAQRVARSFVIGLVAASALVPGFAPSMALAQSGGRVVTITGDRLGGFVLPTTPINADILLQANEAQAWEIDDT
ncbi:MAG: hypothetical protein KDA22_09080, partial [Phycisphaerales bacterium]|nr:hypothetical protein [Phycisphaerales bacterium]